MRLILENSTVCQIVDELVCYAPSSTDCDLIAWLWSGGGGVVVDGFFGKAMILAICQMFVSCRELALFSMAVPFWGVVVVLFFNGEFDPGSGRTLAACLTHASRAERLLRGYSSGERVSNT